MCQGLPITDNFYTAAFLLAIRKSFNGCAARFKASWVWEEALYRQQGTT